MTHDVEKLNSMPDCAVLSAKQVATLTGLSLRTLALLDRERSGPPRVQLSRCRFGYPLGAFREWLKQRTITGDAA
jgi:predicted DNA-binding transcriptional regulator AlpA